MKKLMVNIESYSSITADAIEELPDSPPDTYVNYQILNYFDCY